MRDREKVSLWIRIKKDGKYPYCKPVPKKNGWAFVGGQRECHLEDGVYHLRYELAGKRIWEPVGILYIAAEAQRSIRNGELSLGTNQPPTPARLTLAEQRDKFLEWKNLTKKQDGTKLDAETISAYEQQTAEFLLVATKKVYADQIDGMDLRRYMAALEKRGLTHRTICNHYVSAVGFLKFCKVDHKELLPQNERPRPDDGIPEIYTEKEIIQFFSVITRDRDRIAFEFLLKSGTRQREMACLLWTDITGGDHPVVRIQNHPELGFRTKTGKARSIPLEKGLYDELMSWRRRNPSTKLVFGTKSDCEDTHFLETCKIVARRAGLNCGICEGCTGKHNGCSRFYLHKFRSSFGTWALRAGTDLRTVQAWMGHSSISMTEKYLSPAQGQMVQAKINAAFNINLCAPVLVTAAG